MTDHDGLYHRLYAHRTMVADLIRHLVDHPGVAELDLARMTRINSRFDGDGGARREADIIWRIPTRRGGAVYLYLMLEFQSTVDRWMAVRVMTYVGQFYLHLIREHRLGAGDRLPPVWPVVLYNGDTPWSAPTCLGDLVDLPAESPWHDCQPRLCYLPIDQGRWVAEGRTGGISLTAGLFRVEQSLGPGDLVQALNDLVRALGEDPERESSLERALAGLARRQLTRFGGPAALESLPQSLKENHVMLETRIHQWLEDSKAQGLQQGLQQGVDQGRREEARRLLTDLLTQRFGPLPDWAAPRIAAADLATLEAWTRGVLRAPDLDSLFDDA